MPVRVGNLGPVDLDETRPGLHEAAGEQTALAESVAAVQVAGLGLLLREVKGVAGAAADDDLAGGGVIDGADVEFDLLGAVALDQAAGPFAGAWHLNGERLGRALLRNQRARIRAFGHGKHDDVGRGQDFTVRAHGLQREISVAGRQGVARQIDPFAFFIGLDPADFGLAVLDDDRGARRGAAGQDSIAGRADANHVESRQNGVARFGRRGGRFPLIGGLFGGGARRRRRSGRRLRRPIIVVVGRRQIDDDGEGQDGEGESDEDGDDSGSGQGGDEDGESDQDGEGQGEGQGESTDDESTGNPVPTDHDGHDEHLEPKYDGTPQEQKEQEREDTAEIQRDIDEAVEQAEREGQDVGNLRGATSQGDHQVDPLDDNWEDLLESHLIAKAREGNDDWSRINRRKFSLLGIVAPSKKGSLKRLALIKDISWSVLDRSRALFDAKIAELLDQITPAEGTLVLHTTTEVEQAEDVYSGDEYLSSQKVCGGGTYMSAALDWMEENGEYPDLTVCFTDSDVSRDDLARLAEAGVLIVLDSYSSYVSAKGRLEASGIEFIVVNDRPA